MPTQPNDDNSFDAYTLTGTIEHIDQRQATLRLTDGQTIHWPLKKLPANCAVGSTVRLRVSTADGAAAEQEQLSKAILNEILKHND